MNVTIKIEGESNEIAALLKNLLGKETITTVPKEWITTNPQPIGVTWGTSQTIDPADSGYAKVTCIGE